MTDHEEMTITPEASQEPAAVASRARVGPLRIGALVLAAVFLIAAGVFTFGAISDRDDAQVERREAAAQLHVARDRAESATAKLSTTRAGHRVAMKTVDGLSVSFDELVTLAEREVELAKGALDAGMTNSEARVDEYNDVTSRGNEVIDQYNARLSQIENQISAAAAGHTTTA